jgi:hypothetical protein
MSLLVTSANAVRQAGRQLAALALGRLHGEVTSAPAAGLYRHTMPVRKFRSVICRIAGCCGFAGGEDRTEIIGV